jgi:hypothetical protein
MIRASFYDELEKIGLQRGGEGSRGGKVIGHTSSGDPIYESSNKPGGAPKKKSNFMRNAAIGAGILGGATMIGAGAVHHKRYKDLLRAAKAYDFVGGPSARGQRRMWQNFTDAGDKFYGKNNSWWKNMRNKFHKEHETYKGYTSGSGGYSGSGAGGYSGRSAGYGGRGSGGYSGRTGGGYGGQSARQGYSTASQARAAADKIPGLGKVKTRKEAEKLYREAAKKYHPDVPGGSVAKMQEINSAMDDFRKSDQYKRMKVAMVHWAKMASAMFR